MLGPALPAVDEYRLFLFKSFPPMTSGIPAQTVFAYFCAFSFKFFEPIHILIFVMAGKYHDIFENIKISEISKIS